MKIDLPNSAHLQNLEGFLRKYTPAGEHLRFRMHEKWVHVHPFALAMAACAGELHKTQGKRTIGKVQPVSSLAYLVRMHLFDYVNLDPGLEIEEHEEAGRFIPLTQIRTSDDLHSAIVNLIPLLHAEPEVADPIKYVFSEMVRNVLEHAKSPVGAIVCAQYYRNKERLSIGIADAGRGIRSKSVV